jgi:hypothetical protein
MEEAQRALEAEQSGAAGTAQRRAIDELQTAASAAREGVTPRDTEDRERAEELAREQAELERQLLDLARLDEKRRVQEALERAAANAQKATQSLSEGELGPAREQEQEAEREIREALAEVEEEKRQYQQLRQEELLFAIAEEVRAQIEAHRKLMAETREVDAERKPGEGATRAQRLKLRRIARDEGAIAQRIAEMSQAIEREESHVFAELLANTRHDLELVARDLGEAGNYQSGERVQNLQKDAEQSLVWLAEALEEEKQRRQQDQQQQQQQQQGQQPQNRLVPDVAELKLLRRMEIDVLDALDAMRIENPELFEEGAEVDPLVLEDVTRLAHRHERVTTLFQKFRERLGLPDPEGTEPRPGGQ